MKLRTTLALGLAATAVAISLDSLGHDQRVTGSTVVHGDVVDSNAPHALNAAVASAGSRPSAVEATHTFEQQVTQAWTTPAPAADAFDVTAAANTPRTTATDPARANDKMSPAIAALAATGGTERVDIIVAYDALPAANELGALGARVQRDFPRLGMAQVNVPASALNEFAVQHGVSQMSLDAPLGAASSYAKKTARKPAANSPWNIPVASNVRVAVLDSGVSDLPAMSVAARMDCTAGWTGSTRNYRDDFVNRAFDGNDGADAFSTPWIENGEDDGVTRGALEIGDSYGVCLSDHCMELEAYRANAFTRTLDLQGASGAMLTYVASMNTGAGAAVVEVSSDGTHWHTLASYSYGTAINGLTETFDITPFASANTVLRFRVTQDVDKDDMGVLGIDNLRVDASMPAESCVAAVPQQGAATGNLLDTFNSKSYASNNGSLSFASDWHEVGERNGPSTGDLEVDNDSSLCVAGNCIQIETVTVGDALVRGANLAGAASANVNYVYSSTSGGGAVAFEVSADGGATWSTLASHDMSNVNADIAASFDVTPWLTDDMQVRFRVDQANSWGKIGIDNFEIQVAAASVDAYDQFGHGTHVAGIIGGVESGVVVGDGGVAPNANIVSVRVLDGEGRGVTSDVMAGLDWVLANAAEHDIRVVNLSLGKAVTESVETDPLVAAADAAWDAGLVVVVSAGNYGRDGHFTITSPGNSPKLITVGSLTDAGGEDFSDDYVSTYSSRGPTALDNILKPDLVAPGNRIVSTTSGKSKMAKDLPENDKGHDRFELSGTSMAAAMTSGTAALMLSADPYLTPATVKARLMRSARKISEDPTVAGAGVLDIEAALAETGVMTKEALSPRMARSTTQQNVILVENTSLLWGDETWGAGYLWTDGGNWAQGYLWSDEDVAANGYLWSDESLQSNGFLWTDDSTWANGYLWSDEGLWANGFLWGDESNTQPLFDYGALDVALDDD